MDIKVGDTLKLKKKHPCGSQMWKVLRVGIDFRLSCEGCGHQIMIASRSYLAAGQMNPRGKMCRKNSCSIWYRRNYGERKRRLGGGN